MVIQLPNWSAGITGRIYHTGKGLLALPSAVVSGSWYGSSWSLEMLPSARCEGTGTLVAGTWWWCCELGSLGVSHAHSSSLLRLAVLLFSVCWIPRCWIPASCCHSAPSALSWHQERTEAASRACSTWHVQWQDCLSPNEIKALCSPAVQCMWLWLLSLATGKVQKATWA